MSEITLNLCFFQFKISWENWALKTRFKVEPIDENGESHRVASSIIDQLEEPLTLSDQVKEKSDFGLWLLLHRGRDHSHDFGGQNK